MLLGAPRPHSAIQRSSCLGAASCGIKCGLHGPVEWTAAAGALHATLQQPSGARPVSAHTYRAQQQAVVPMGPGAAVIDILSSISHAECIGRQHPAHQAPLNTLSQSGLPGAVLPQINRDTSIYGTGLWCVGDAGDVLVEVVSGDVASEGTGQQQQYQQHHRHRRRRGGTNAADHHDHQQPQQQSIGDNEQQQWQPVTTPLQHVQLLQQTALVRSWSGALRVLEQQHYMQQAHVGLLWWQLEPKLRARQCAAAATAACDVQVTHGSHQQRVRQVLHHLCKLTQQHAKSMSPQSLGYALQGIAAAVAAGEVVLSNAAEQRSQCVDDCRCCSSSAAVPCLDKGLEQQLWRRLLEVAGSCTAQQLSRCLEGGRRLGWQLSNASSSPAELCCWAILEAACSGLLAAGGSSNCHQNQHDHYPQQQHCRLWSSSEASELLVSLARLLASSQGQQRLVQQQPSQQLPAHHRQWQHFHSKPWHQQHPAVHRTVQSLLACACQFPKPAEIRVSLNQGINTGNLGQETNSRPSNGAWPCSLEPQQQLQAAVSVLQSAVVLGVLPDLGQLERLVDMLEANLDLLPTNGLLQALAALLQMHIEPWESWLVSFFRRLESELHLLSHEQLLQLLLLLPHITVMQPSRQLLQGLARFSAVHCHRYSWEQLAALSGAFAAVRYHPPAYWFKDYLAATSSCLQQQLLLQQQKQKEEDNHLQQATDEQQQYHVGQQQQQHVLGVQICIAVVVGVSRLGHPAVPAAWLSVVEAMLVAHLQQLQGMLGPSSSAATGAAQAVVQGLAAFRQLKHTPSPELLALLAAAHCSVSNAEQAAGSAGPLQLHPQAVAVDQDAVYGDQQRVSHSDSSSSTTSCAESCIGGGMHGSSLVTETKQEDDTLRHRQRQQEPDLRGHWQLDFKGRWNRELLSTSTEAMHTFVTEKWLAVVDLPQHKRQEVRSLRCGCVQQEESELAVTRC